MELESRIAELTKTVREHREVLLTEEAAKTALVMPFLQALGYNVFNPSEVVPEYTCDVGTKKGEKVDYAICDGGKIRRLYTLQTRWLTGESHRNICRSAGPTRTGLEVSVASQSPASFVLHVRFEDRDDGGLRTYCDKLPNFFLSHSDRAKVQADIEPALQVILSAMYGRAMSVRRLPELDEAMDHQIPLAHTIMQESYLGAIEAY